MRKILAFFSTLLVTNIAFAQAAPEELVQVPQQSHTLTWIETAIVIILGTIYFLHGIKQFNKYGVRQHLSAAPGIFTSLGILGTFA